jgi:hypothetical protein
VRFAGRGDHRGAWFSGSEKRADVFGGQNVLVEHQTALRDLPGTGHPSQDVPARADIEILLGFGAAAIDEKV